MFWSTKLSNSNLFQNYKCDIYNMTSNCHVMFIFGEAHKELKVPMGPWGWYYENIQMELWK
jgi:hypothetical protein